MRIVFAFLLLVTIPSLGHAQTPRIDRIEIRTVGVYEAVIGTPVQDRDAAAGRRNVVRSYEFVSRGTIIPLRRNIRFGFEYVISGAPTGATASLRQVLIFPSPGLRNPAKGQTWEHEEIKVSSVIGNVSRTGYALEENWEMVPGTWTFQLWDGNRKLAEQSFTAVRP